MLGDVCFDCLSCTCQLKDFIRQAHQMTADKPPDICTAKAPGQNALQVERQCCGEHDHVQHSKPVFAFHEVAELHIFFTPCLLLVLHV